MTGSGGSESFDLNGCTITFTGNQFGWPIWVQNGTFTFKNGTINGENGRNFQMFDVGEESSNTHLILGGDSEDEKLTVKQTATYDASKKNDFFAVMTYGNNSSVTVNYADISGGYGNLIKNYGGGSYPGADTITINEGANISGTDDTSGKLAAVIMTTGKNSGRTTVNINGGTITSKNPSEVLYLENGADFTMTGGTIRNTGTNGWGIGVHGDSSGTLNVDVNGGEITSDNSIAVALYGASATLTITKAKITGTHAIQVGSTVYSPKGKLIVNPANNEDVKITGTTGYGIQLLAEGEATISGGTIAGQTYGVINQGSGTAEISGGKISATQYRGVYNYATGAVNISGGDITGNDTYGAVGNNSDSTGTLTVTGGTFSYKPADSLISDGYLSTQVNSSFVVASAENAVGWKSISDAEQNYFVAPESGKSATNIATLAGADSTLTLTTATTGTQTIPVAVAERFPSNTAYKTVDASGAVLPVDITGDGVITAITGGAGADSLTAGASGVTLDGGAGDDFLTGGAGADTFVYNGGKDSISGYTTADTVSLSSDFEPVKDFENFTADGSNFTFNFDDKNKLIFTNTSAVSLRSGRNTYVYTPNSIAQGKGITLAAGSSFDAGDYATVDASAVTTAFSITGNSLNNVIRGGSEGGTLAGGAGSDTVSGGTGADTFVYTAGKDVIEGYGASDSVSLGTEITGGRFSNGSLIFSTANKSNTLTLKDVDETAQIALSGGGYLTKEGNLSDTKLTLFKENGGRIEQASGITEIDARNVSNKVTLVGALGGGKFTLGSNKKNDVFEYGGGAATLTGYEAGKDKVNLAYKFNSFDVSGQNVSLSTDKGDLILQDALNQEINIANGSNRYSKMIFAGKSVIADKAKNPTSVTLYSGISDYTASDKTIKKINFADGVSAMNITGNDKANVIDLSKVTLGSDSSGFTISSGAGNDKITGSNKADTFTYTGGKDAISNYDSTDSISIGDRSLETAKISASKKSITFKFNSKDSLTIKSKNDIGSLNIGGTSYSFKKNAVKTGNSVDLTNNFSGTFKVESGVSTVDGSDAKKSLTLTGTSAAESLIGGTKKTKFKGGGGQDTLVGGSGEDTFFFAKKDAAGDVTVANFDYAKDKLKIASKTLSNISTSGVLEFTLTNGEKVTLKNTKDAAINVGDVLLKANNTLYWFDSDGVTLTDSKGGAGETYDAGWFTFSKKNSDMTEVMRNYKKGGYAVVDLGYSTNLVKAGLAQKIDESKVYNSTLTFAKKTST